MLLSQFSSFGFAGRRSGAGVPVARALAASLPVGAAVFATCGRGVQAVGAAVPGAVVFRQSSPAFSGLAPRARFAIRAAAFVAALAAAPSPVLLVWPGVPAPFGLLPQFGRKRWQSCGSGSWSEMAVAVGWGLPVVVFGHRPPAPARPVSVSGFSGWLVSPVQTSLILIGTF